MGQVYTKAHGWIEKGQHVTTREHSGHVTTRDLPPAPPTIEQRIFVVVAQYGRAVTRREIASALRLKSTGWLNGKIDGLVSNGYLRREHGKHSNGVVKFLYEINQ